jgi:WD40 repeat protein
MHVLLLVAAIAQVLLASTPASPATSIRFSPDGSLLAIGAGNQVRLVPVNGGSERRMESRLLQVFAVVWSGDGKWLAIGGGTPGVSGAVEIWDPANLEPVRTVARGGDVLYALAFSPDSLRLAAAGADHRTAVVDVVSGETLFRLAGHVGPVLAVSYSPDGATIATGSADRSIRLWTSTSGALIRSLTNHNGAVQAVLFSPGGTTLFSASADATVRVWVPGNGRMKHILRGYDQAVLALDFVPSLGLLLSGSADGSVRLTHPDNGDLVEHLAMDANTWPQTVAVSTDGSTIAWADTSGRHVIRRIHR